MYILVSLLYIFYTSEEVFNVSLVNIERAQYNFFTVHKPFVRTLFPFSRKAEYIVNGLAPNLTYVLFRNSLVYVFHHPEEMDSKQIETLRTIKSKPRLLSRMLSLLSMALNNTTAF